jgi:hypothetical protein
MPERKEPELTPAEQFKRFKDAARDLGCDDNEDTFDRALKKIVSAPPPKSVQKRKTKPKRRARRA